MNLSPFDWNADVFCLPLKHFVERVAVTPIQITELSEGKIVETESFVTYIMHFTFYFSGRMKIIQMESLIWGATDACCHIEVLIWGDDNLSKRRQASVWLVFHFVIQAEKEILAKMYGISVSCGNFFSHSWHFFPASLHESLSCLFSAWKANDVHMYQINMFSAVQLVFGEEGQIIVCWNVSLADEEAAEAWIQF